ncbi:hypothetical protein FB45DRAFT_872871 [Roridomyces roridus]|uniref:Uncharacterized protein n=1 Tax=Roridomyces roridus TaxID=1738132 RepID=A0AAD7FCS9_9AGAR|nr:hypothetical protein FB45DRAFT_872871 [Roridomyces roridus]
MSRRHVVTGLLLTFIIESLALSSALLHPQKRSLVLPPQTKRTTVQPPNAPDVIIPSFQVSASHDFSPEGPFRVGFVSKAAASVFYGRPRSVDLLQSSREKLARIRPLTSVRVEAEVTGEMMHWTSRGLLTVVDEMPCVRIAVVPGDGCSWTGAASTGKNVAKVHKTGMAAKRAALESNGRTTNG